MAERWAGDRRLGGLRRFAAAITILNLLGHTVLGFEQSWAQPLVGVGTAYAVEVLLEALDAWRQRRRPRFLHGRVAALDFLLSAHISGLAVSMLLYANERLAVVGFAAAAAIASKAIARAPLPGGGTRHFLNPSNFGITLTLLLFPWVGNAPPYHFTEGLAGVGDWVMPGIVVLSGSFLNWRFTQRLPLIGAWLGGFALQAVLRSLFLGNALEGSLLPFTGVAFILFTFYMITDPATTPSGTRAQVLFGASVAACYALFMMLHVVFGLFYALTTVTALRGLGLYAAAWAGSRAAAGVPAPAAIGSHTS